MLPYWPTRYPRTAVSRVGAHAGSSNQTASSTGAARTPHRPACVNESQKTCDPAPASTSPAAHSSVRTENAAGRAAPGSRRRTASGARSASGPLSRCSHARNAASPSGRPCVNSPGTEWATP